MVQRNLSIGEIGQGGLGGRTSTKSHLLQEMVFVSDPLLLNPEGPLTAVTESGIDVAVAGRIVRIATVAGAAARAATATLLDPIISIPRPKKKILETSPAMR